MMTSRKARSFLFSRVAAVLAAFILILIVLRSQYRDGKENDLYPVHEIAPRLPVDAVPIGVQPSSSSCTEVTFKPIRQFDKPESHPDPLIGELRYRGTERCTRYADRYGPYEDDALGITYLHGYAIEDIRSASDYDETERRGNGRIHQLIRLNTAAEAGTYIDWGTTVRGCQQREGFRSTQALVVQVHENYTWGHDDILNMRALIAELALKPAAAERFDVALIVDIWSKNVSFSMSEVQREKVLASSVPREFWSITHFTTEEQRQALYPGLVITKRLKNSQTPHNSYRNCFMPLQIFSHQHRRYDHIWGWEMDVRSTANIHDLIRDLERYARRTSIDDKMLVQQQYLHVGGARKTYGENDDQEADLITLNPIFDPLEQSGWYWEHDFQSECDWANLSNITLTLR